MAVYDRKNYSHTYMRDKKNNARVRSEISAQSYDRRMINKIQNEEKYGRKSGHILIGEKDRIIGNPPQVIEDEKNKNPYMYGYLERGSRVLEGLFSNNTFSPEKQRKSAIADYINGVPEEYIVSLKKYPAYLEGRLYQMGRASYDYIVENNMTIEEYIGLMGIINPEINNPSFLEGYNARFNEEKLNTSGKKRK